MMSLPHRTATLLAPLALCLSLLGGVPAPALAATGVTLNPDISVEGPVVRLGDLFAGLGDKASIPVARAPSVGNRVQLDARWLSAVAQRYGVAWRAATLLDQAVVERASQVITANQIEQKIKAALRKRGQSAELTVQLDNPTLSIRLPKEFDATVEVTGLSHDSASGRFVVQLSAPNRDRPFTQSTVSGRAVQMTDVPTLGRQVMPGEAIEAADIDWIQMPVEKIGRGVVLDISLLVGMTTRRPVRVGEPIRQRDLRQPVVVPKNSLVSIVYQTERMLLTAQGRALEDGALGNVVRIMNTKSNTVINAVVAAPGRVTVRGTTTAALN